jgi:hypothetical protein
VGEKALSRALAGMYTSLFEEEDRQRQGRPTARNLALLWVRSLLGRDQDERADLRSFLRVFTQPVMPGEPSLWGGAGTANVS